MKNKIINKIIVMIMFLSALFYFYKTDKLDENFENVGAQHTNLEETFEKEKAK